MTFKKTALLTGAVLLSLLLCSCGTNNGSPQVSTNPEITSVPPSTSSVPGASGASTSPSAASPSPSVASPAASGTATAGISPGGTTKQTIFIGKVTAKNGSLLTLDVRNDSFQTVNGGPSPSVGATAGTTPTGGGGITTNVPLPVPDTAVITLKSGSTGSVSDIKVGDTLSVTLTDSNVSAITISG